MRPHGDEQAGSWEGMLHNVLDFNAVHGNTAVTVLGRSMVLTVQQTDVADCSGKAGVGMFRK